MKYTSNLLGGFQTSPGAAVHHTKAAIRINEAYAKREALNGDKTRSKGEKSPMFKKLSEQYDKALASSLDAYQKFLGEQLDAHEKAEAAMLNRVSLVDAVQIVASLRAAGLNGDALSKAAAGNVEIATAMARVPSELSQWSADTAKATLLRHYPDHVAAVEQLEHDYRAFQSLQKTAAQTVRELSYDVDEQALQSRFDAESLEGELGAPSTSAEGAE